MIPTQRDIMGHGRTAQMSRKCPRDVPLDCQLTQYLKIVCSSAVTADHVAGRLRDALANGVNPFRAAMVNLHASAADLIGGTLRRPHAGMEVQHAEASTCCDDNVCGCAGIDREQSGTG